MPNTLPVPSKAALRTLRNLALGTSCTVAFTTGLLTEDRRRRIHAAREVHSNAEKIKSSRKYHSGGNLSAESFEDQVLRYRNDGFWQTKEVLSNIEPEHTALPLRPRIPEYSYPPQIPPNPSKIRKDEHFPVDDTMRARYSRFRSTRMFEQPAFTDRQERMTLDVTKSMGDKDGQQPASMDRQERLALDITKLLEDKHGKSNIEAAAARFFDAFEEGIPVESFGLTKRLTDAAALLSKACQLDNKLEVSEKILDIVLRYGPIDKDVFESLGAEAIVTNLINGGTGDSKMELSMLRKAAALYLTKFDEKPGGASNSWRSLGETLCATTCHKGFFDLTEKLYFSVGQSRGDAPDDSFQYLMTALHKQERHTAIVKVFIRFFANTCPSPSTFHAMGDIVIESTMKIRRIDKAEEALGILATVSREQNVKCSTTWFLKVLGGDWRTCHDITRTRALFERLTPLFRRTFFYRAIYSVMIQISIEAGDEAAARSYYDYILKDGHSVFDKLELKIRGYFALGKALRNDWTGVKEDFQRMREMEEYQEMKDLNTTEAAIGAAFTPIFKLFAKSHPVNETEEFLRTFIDHHYVVLTPYMSTTMINKYAQAKEIDSISRWFDYMVSVQSPADSKFFNAIIHNCHKKWRFSFQETYRLYHRVKGMGGKKFIDESTISILRRAAMAGAPQNISAAVRNLSRLKLEQPLRLSVESSSVQEHMDVALTKGDPQRALRIYERARKNVVPLDTPCVSTAVKASLQADPNDIYAAARLLQKPQTDGHDISNAVATIFIHQLSCGSLNQSQSRVQDLAMNTFSVLESHGVTILPRMITHTMHTLVHQGQYHEAIEFWNSTSSSQTASAPLDLPTLTVFLQAYIALRDCTGIEWTVQMVSMNGFVPDEHFKRALDGALRKTRKLLEANEHEYSTRQFCYVLKQSYKTVLAMRFDATEEKENVKIKTIKIMEKAIEFDRSLKLKAEAEKIGELRLRSPPGEHQKLPIVPGEEQLGACSWMEPDETSDYVSYVPPRGRLVGVNAG